jgi:hypothetical protein
MSYRETAIEVSCVLAWSESARVAYVKALREWEKKGRPPIPLGAKDYRQTHRRKKCVGRHRGTSGSLFTMHSSTHS